MPATSSEKIRMIARRQNITLSQLADLLQISRQALNDRLKRDNIKENDLKQIAESLNCTYEGSFIMNETGEKF